MKPRPASGDVVRRSRATTSPLAKTLECLAALDAGGLNLTARHGIPEGARWVTASDLADANEALLENLLQRTRRQYGIEDQAVVGTLFLRGYLWRILVLSVAAFLTERLLPDLHPEDVALSFDERGAAAGLAFRGRFAVLEEDPRAADPGATALAGEGEMLDRMGKGLTDSHLPELFSALRRCGMRRADRALWGVSADILAEALA